MKFSKILLIDNNKSIKKLIQKIFHASKYKTQIILCKDKKNLIEQLNTHNFDLILINNELTWTCSKALIDLLIVEKPYVGKIVFSHNCINQLSNDLLSKVEFVINKIRKNKENLLATFTFAFNRAKEKRKLGRINEEFLALFNNVHIGLFKLDTTGKIQTCNDTLAKLLGFNSKSELIGRELKDFIIVQHNKDLDNLFKISNKQGNLQFIQGKVKIKRKDGEIIWVAIDTKPIYFENNILLNLYGSVKDISDEVKLMQEKIDRQNNLQLFIDSANTYFVVLDKNGLILMVNKKLADFYGLSKEELIGNKWSDVILNKKQRERFDVTFQKILSGNIEHYSHTETRKINSQGDEIVILWHNTVIKNGHEITAIISSGIDITERKKLEVALKNSVELYKRIFENAGTSMVVIEGKDTIIACNSKFQLLSGYSHEEIINSKWSKFVHKNDLDYLNLITKERFEKPESFPRNINFRIITLNNQSKTIWAVIDAIPNTNKTVISMQDITDKVILEQVKEISYQQLEMNIEQFAILIDSIRNPISVIMGLTDIEENEITAQIAEQAKLIDEILQQLDRRWLESINVKNFLSKYES
ncbi:MAG: PAS domain-containing protein [Candidatus Heimdallarchaeota archaeon]|nr:PAS domain-containing protein [Candidatus Heimdallarchaeota archaeon]